MSAKILTRRSRWCLNEVRPGRPEQSTVRLPPRRGKKCLNEVRPGRPEQWRCITYVPGEVDVSMKSGLEGRNNAQHRYRPDCLDLVSMKSGLEGRNNLRRQSPGEAARESLNEVRPRRPEQSGPRGTRGNQLPGSLNEVRPRRPEQSRLVVPHQPRQSLSQ